MSAPIPKIGDVLGDRYRLDGNLGSGGMGTVFSATHLLTHKQVAIKWIAAEGVLSSDETWQRFLREARVASTARHPHIVEVYDIGEGANGFYLVMELLLGDPLETFLNREKPKLHEIVALLLPALRGLGSLHRKGIIHRDVKTSNIFVARNEDGSVFGAKILDFGISKLPESSNFRLTASGTVMGSPRYMSPEQFKQFRDVDARSDVYSFGVVLQAALTGRHPFEDASSTMIAVAIANGARPRARTVNPSVSPELEAVLERALDVAPEERFADADALADALEPFTAEERAQVSTGVGTTTLRAGSSENDATRPAVPTDASAAPAIGSAWTETPSTAPPSPSSVPPTRTSARPPKSKPAPKPARRRSLRTAPMWIGAALIAMAMGAAGATAFIVFGRRAPGARASSKIANEPSEPTAAIDEATNDAVRALTSNLSAREPGDDAEEAPVVHHEHHTMHHPHSSSTTSQEVPDRTSPVEPAEVAPTIEVPPMLDDPWADDDPEPSTP